MTPVDRRELLGLIESESARVVDVLPADEYEEGHLPGAINVPTQRAR